MRLDQLRDDTLFKSIETGFQQLLQCSDQSTTRAKYKKDLAGLRKDLIRLRAQAVVLADTGQLSAGGPPLDFSRLVSDAAMIEILRRRWDETIRCTNAGAHLAATVMMGAILEALLLARVNRLPDLAPVSRASAAPRDKETGETLPLKEWTLKHYIDVAHEMKWIRKSAKDVGEILRDYRNYIHPDKELKHGVSLDARDTRMFWTILQTLGEQVIESA